MSVDIAMTPDGRWSLGHDGDFALSADDDATRAELLRAFLQSPGDLPLFPDVGAGAEAKEGGPQSGGDALARAALVEARRHPDVLEASAAEVVRSPGLTTVSVRVRTRYSPRTTAAVSTRING